MRRARGSAAPGLSGVGTWKQKNAGDIPRWIAKGLAKAGYSVLRKSAFMPRMMACVNRGIMIPQGWGKVVAGGHPQTPGRSSPAPVFGQSKIGEAEASHYV